MDFVDMCLCIVMYRYMACHITILHIQIQRDILHRPDNNVLLMTFNNLAHLVQRDD